MTSKRALTFAISALVITGFAALAAGAISAANARPGDRNSRTPVMAVVALSEQRISVYDAAGNKMLEAPVSSGAKGLETPAGIYSVVQKEEDHQSNLYEDGNMPYMQRITWTGMALHGGILPGYPASHGCVRLPTEFAERLYYVTELGLRVIVVREDVAPAEIAQPALFTRSATSNPESPDAQMRRLRSIVRAKSSAAETATRREEQARSVAARKAAEAASVVRQLRAAESNLAKAEAEVKAAEGAMKTAVSPGRRTQAEQAKEKALGKVEAARTQLESAKLQAQPKTDAAAQAEEEARVAAAAINAAVEAAEEVKRNLSPVSVFISRKTQRLYIRKGNYPVFESHVMIRDADKPIGTFVYTALNDTRWNVVSMYKDAVNVEPYAQAQEGRTKARRTDPAAKADVGAAQKALNRIVLPEEAADRISEVVLPGSSLIISDEAASIETGKDTDFVVLMSGEPQGGIAKRRHDAISRAERYDRYEYDGAPWGYSRGRRPSRYGFPLFFLD